MPYRACTVTFEDRSHQGTAHVDAQSVYEAAVLALKFFNSQRHSKSPRRHTVLTIETTKPAHFLAEVKVSAVLDWLYGRKSPTLVSRSGRRGFAGCWRTISTD